MVACALLPAVSNGQENSMDIKGKKIAILATNGFEQSELEVRVIV